MASPVPAALGHYLFLVRIILFVVLLPAGIQNLSMATYEGTSAQRIGNLKERAPEMLQRVERETAQILAATPPQANADGYQARRLYTLALRMEDMGWDHPDVLAWIGALTQLFGGGLLLLGLMTRIWGFSLCVVVSALFVLDSWPLIAASPTSFLHLDKLAANQVGLHLCLFGLSLAMVVSGAGKMSLDGMIVSKLQSGSAEPEAPGDDDD
jgi:uncharacterized membrane protein YphA (DoxX/SURF4 family)